MKITENLPYQIAFCGFLGLFSLLMLWNTVLAPSVQRPVAFMLLLTVSPLLLPMRGFLNKRRKSCAWLAFTSLMYFIHGCLEAYANAATRTYSTLEILLSLMIFFGSAFYIRLSTKTSTPHG